MSHSSRSVLLLVAFLSLFGCSMAAKKLDMPATAILITKSNYTLDDVEKAILRAGKFSSWDMKKERDNIIIATHSGYIPHVFSDPEPYSMSATITYNSLDYKITFKNCTANYQFNEGGKTQINFAYDFYVGSLDNAIQLELKNIR